MSSPDPFEVDRPVAREDVEVVLDDDLPEDFDPDLLDADDEPTSP